MTMSTIYVLVRDREVIAVAESTDPSTAVAQLSRRKGEVYACRLSDSAAAQVRDAVLSPKGNVTRGVAPTTPLSLLKMYSQAMVKVADSTGV